MARTAEEIAQSIAERQQRAAERAEQAQQRSEERAQRNAERAAAARDKNASRDLDRALKTFGAAAPIIDMIGRAGGALTGIGGTREAADGVRDAAGHNAQTQEELARQRREAVMGAGQPPRANSGFPAQGGDEFRPQTNIGRGQAPQGHFAAPERQLRVSGDEASVAQAPAANERGSRLMSGDRLYTQALELVASANVYQANGNTQKRDEMIEQARGVVAQIPKDAFGTLAEPPEADGRRVSTSVVKVNGQEVRYHISERDNATPEGLLEKMANKAATQQGVPSVAPALKASAPKKVGEVAPETRSVEVGMVTPEGAPAPAPAAAPHMRKMIFHPETGQVEDGRLKLQMPANDTLKAPVANKAPVSELKRGGTESVAAVQKNLEILGFATDAGGASDGKVDGIAGKRTQEAVRKVEAILIKAGKLDGKADGVIDDKFVAALEAAKKDPKLVAQLEEASGKKTAAAAPAQTAQVGVSGDSAGNAAALAMAALAAHKQRTQAPTEEKAPLLAHDRTNMDLERQGSEYRVRGADALPPAPAGAAGLGIRADREEVIGAVVTKSAEQIRADEKAVVDALKQQTQATTPPTPLASSVASQEKVEDIDAIIKKSSTIIDKEADLADSLKKSPAPAAPSSYFTQPFGEQATAAQPSMNAALAQAREAAAGQRLQVAEAGNAPAAPQAVGTKPLQDQGLTA